MKTRIEALEKAAAEHKVVAEGFPMNQKLQRAYIYSWKQGNEVPNFEYIWDEDLDEIIEDCKNYGITEFTISNAFTDLLTILSLLEERGCKVAGTVKVNTHYYTKVAPALEITVC